MVWGRELMKEREEENERNKGRRCGGYIIGIKEERKRYFVEK